MIFFISHTALNLPGRSNWTIFPWSFQCKSPLLGSSTKLRALRAESPRFHEARNDSWCFSQVARLRVPVPRQYSMGKGGTRMCNTPFSHNPWRTSLFLQPCWGITQHSSSFRKSPHECDVLFFLQRTKQQRNAHGWSMILGVAIHLPSILRSFCETSLTWCSGICPCHFHLCGSLGRSDLKSLVTRFTANTTDPELWIGYFRHLRVCKILDHRINAKYMHLLKDKFGTSFKSLLAGSGCKEDFEPSVAFFQWLHGDSTRVVTQKLQGGDLHGTGFGTKVETYSTIHGKLIQKHAGTLTTNWEPLGASGTWCTWPAGGYPGQSIFGPLVWGQTLILSQGPKA